MKDVKTWLIIGLVILVALLIIFRRDQPQDQTEGKAFKDTIDKLTAEKAVKDAQVATLFKESESKDSTTKVELRAKDKEISLLKVKLSKQRPPITVMADSIPELKAFIATQDSLIAATEQRADTLQRAYTSQIETTRDLKKLIVDKDRIQQEMYVTCAEALDKAQKQIEKEHKGKITWRKIGQITIVVALVEAALIALQ